MKTVSSFYEAFGAKDWKRLRSILTDDFTFQGSLATFDSPDEYVEGMKALPLEGEPVDSRFAVDGTNVVHSFTWKMTAPVTGEIDMCEWIELEGDKVRSSRLFYDSQAMPTPG